MNRGTRSIASFAIAGALLAASLPARAELALATKLDPADTVRGALVTVTGHGLPAHADIRLDSFDAFPASPTSADQAGLTFWVPSTVAGDKGPLRLPLGEHAVHILDRENGDREVPFAIPSEGRLSIDANVRQSLKLSTIEPRVIFPTGSPQSVTLIGEGFSPVGEDQTLLVDGREIAVNWTFGANEGVRGSVNPSGREIAVQGLGIAPGEHKLRLRRGTQVSDELPFIAAGCTGNQARIGAAIGVAVLFAILLAIAARASRAVSYTVADTRYRFLSRIFIDPETDTYSLSRLQFFAWTTVVAFAYTYLALVLALVQRRFETPDLPSTVPGILALSLGTGVTALGIKAAKGPEGAGTVRPSWGDFLSTGGVIAPEKFQFLLWTLLGVAGFLFTTMSVEVERLSDLPKVPSNLLYLMGVSSFGYLGGKIARKTGPIVDSIVPVSPSILEVRGRGLSKDASIFIDGADAAQLLTAASGRRPVPGDTDPNDSTLATVLALNFEKNAGWSNPPSRAPRILRVVNPDGQRAEWPIGAPPPPAAGSQAVASPTPAPVAANAVVSASTSPEAGEGPPPS